MIPNTIFVVLLILFTTKGPVVMHVQAPDLETCMQMANSAPSTFDGQKVPLSQDGGEPEATMVLDAQAFCRSFTKLEHA